MGDIADLSAAYALYLRNVEQEGAFHALADARVPVNMRGLFENGDGGRDAARCALEYARLGAGDQQLILVAPTIC